MPYYAVAKGRTPGVYTTWDDAKRQVDGFKYPKYRKFDTKEAAEAFVKDIGVLQQMQANVETLGHTGRSKDEVTKEGLIVFTDGSAIGNGKKNAKAGYAAVWPNHPHLTFAKPLEGAVKTNNRAEFMACIDALHAADAEDPMRKETIHIFTDSELLINTVTKWMGSWKRNGWRKSSGEPIMNEDLVKRLDEFVRMGRPIKWTHVDAHTGKSDWASVWNDKVDKLAKSAAA